MLLLLDVLIENSEGYLDVLRRLPCFLSDPSWNKDTIPGVVTRDV